MRGITASTNDIPAASGKRQLFSVGRLITPASFGKAASVILSALLVMGFVSGPLLSSRQAHAAGAFCNCVVMRTDDYQDYWLHTVASSLVQLFVDKKTIQTTGLIMNAFGDDPVIVNKVQQAVSSGNAELAVHGWDHVDFSQMSLSQQNSAIHNATNKMMSLFGKTSRIFLPPYNLFNNNTLSALRSNGYTIFSADKFTDTYPYAPSRDSFGVMHIPSTIETGYINANGHWSLNDNSQIIAALDADVASQGYAVLTIHPQQYAILSGGQEADVINQTRWNQLSDIIDNMKSKHNIVGFSTIESVYSSSQSIFINPWNGPAGTQVTIVGSGFAANSPSKIYFDGKQVSTVTTNSSGGITPGTATFAVPLPYPSGSKQVMVADANGAGNSATTAFTIVNSAPVANGSRIQTVQNTAAAVSLGASDANNDPLTYSIVSAPSHGTLAGVAPSLIYTPASNYVGTDSFAFKANDGTADSNIATISINVTYSSSISANPQSLSTYQNVQKSILLTGSGGSGKPLSFSLVNSPIHGSLYGTPPDLTYTPSLNYLGPDSFSFTVSNDTSTSSPATVTLTVSPPVTYPVSRMSDTVKSGATSIFGQKLLASEFVSAGSALVGKQIDSMTIGLSKSGTPTGTAQVGVFGADLSEKKSFGTKDVSTLTTTSTDYTFQLANNDLYTIQSGDYIGVEYSGGSASSYVLVMRDWTNNFDGANSYRAYYNGIWNNVTGDDMYMTLKQTHPAPTGLPLTANPQMLTTGQGVPVAVALTGSGGNGNSLTFKTTTVAAHGVISGTAPNLTYTPGPRYHGPDSFNFTATDGSSTSPQAVVSVNVVDTTVPVATPQSATVRENGQILIKPAATDADNDTLTFAISASPNNGVVILNANATITYTPKHGFQGSDAFNFTASDGTKASAPARITITVHDDTVPVASNVAATIVENSNSLSITPSAADADGDNMTFSIVTPPSHGSAQANVNGTITYVPSLNYYGSDAFQYAALDDGGNPSPAANVTITISRSGHPPVATGSSVQLAENSNATVQLNAADADNDTLSYVIVTAPAHGTLNSTGPGGAVRVYTPAANYHGLDFIAFKANDGKFDSNIAMVNLTVSDTTVPVAKSQSVALDKNQFKIIVPLATDADGDKVSFAIAAPPSHGVASPSSNGTITYTPSANYSGPDQFSITASDGTNTSPPALMNVTVLDTVAPQALPLNITTNENSPVLASPSVANATINATISISIVSPPAHGSAVLNTNGTMTYLPSSNYHGKDQFTFAASDGRNTGPSATASVTVIDNSIPSVSNQSISASKNTPKLVMLSASDRDGDVLSFSIYTAPAHGTAVLNANRTVTFTPNHGFLGNDSLQVVAYDGTNTSPPASIGISVADNVLPIALSLTASTVQNASVVITPYGIDPDGDPVAFSITSSPSNGIIGDNGNGTVTYIPKLGFFGSDSFTYSVHDADGNTSPKANVSIAVTRVNHAPNASGGTIATSENATRLVALNATDADNDPLTYIVVSLPNHGTIAGAGSNNTLSYRPNPNFHGFDSITFKAFDRQAFSNIANVTIFIMDSSTPAAKSQMISTFENTAKALRLNATDLDADPLTFSVTAGPYHGVVTGTAPNLTYTPASNYHGTDAFNFTASDGRNTSPSTIILVNLIDNSVPSASAQSLSTNENAALLLSPAATDSDNDKLTFAIAAAPLHGTAVLNSNGTITYTPANNYAGQDRLNFTASDGTNTSPAATISLTVLSTVVYPITQMSDTVASGGTSVYSAKQMDTEYVSATSVLVGKQIDSITVQLAKSGSPAGTVQVGVFNSTLGVKQLFGTIDPASLTTKYANYTFQLSGSQLYTIKPGDYIGIKFTGGSSTNYVLVMRDWLSSFDGTNTYRAWYNTAWNNYTADDMYMLLKQTHG